MDNSNNSIASMPERQNVIQYLNVVCTPVTVTRLPGSTLSQRHTKNKGPGQFHTSEKVNWNLHFLTFNPLISFTLNLLIFFIFRKALPPSCSSFILKCEYRCVARGGFNQTVPKCFKYSASSRTRDEITSQITRRHEETRPRTHAARAAAPPRVHLPPLCQLLKRLHLPPPPGRLSLPRPSLWLLRSFLFSTQLLAGWLAGWQLVPWENATPSLPQPSLRSLTCQTGSVDPLPWNRSSPHCHANSIQNAQPTQCYFPNSPKI